MVLLRNYPFLLLLLWLWSLCKKIEWTQNNTTKTIWKKNKQIEKIHFNTPAVSLFVLKLKLIFLDENEKQQQQKNIINLFSNYVIFIISFISRFASNMELNENKRFSSWSSTSLSTKSMYSKYCRYFGCLLSIGWK